MPDAPRGLDANQEFDRNQLVVDVRPWKEKFREKLEKPDYFVTIAGFLLAILFVFPFLTEFVVIATVGFIIYAKQIRMKLPFRSPMSSDALDLNFLPSKTKPDPVKHKGKAITYFGNELKSRKELWFENDDIRTHILIFGSTGAGKALRNDELVHTPTGWRKNKDLQVGDMVSTPFGASAITGVYPQGELELYKVKFEDGREIDVSGEHLWEVHHKGWPTATLANGVRAKAKLLTTEKLLRLVSHNHGPHNYSIILPKEVEKTTQNVQKPYLDCADTCQFISDELKSGSVAQRYEVLQRLMDQQAQIYKGRVAFKTVYSQLAHDVAELVRSLGGIAYFKEENDKYTVYIKHTSVSKLFSNQQKKEQATQLESHIPLRLAIRSVEKLDTKEECQCIKIEDPRGLFITKDYIVTHNTETLLSLAFNALVQGSGLIYVDGKGDVSLFTKIFSMARRVGREDDILVINYMTGSRDVFAAQEHKLSNTLNPFANGSSGGLTELLVSLMDDGGGDGMWKGRAISLISALMMALCYMRDYDGLLLDVDVIREYLILDNIIKLYKTRRDLPSNIRQSIRGYIMSLPGYQENAPKQNDTALEQHGYLQMQFTKLLGSLSDTYGYIFKTNLGEVDFKDVVLNRRILIVLLPALEKSSDELANLGKIIVACLKQMMAEGLGNKLEGEHSQVIETRPTNSASSFVCILDEYGYYSVKGAAVMPAQARSLGFSMIFAGQDYAAFKKGDEKEAESIVANCNIKIFMKLEDPMATYELFEKSVGEGLTTQTTRYIKNKNGGLFGGGGYIKDEGVSPEVKKRGNLLDLKDQGPGEAHILFKSSLVRAQMFYANPKNAKEYRVNYFVRVEPPEVKEIQQLDTSLRELYAKISDPSHLEEVQELIDEEEDLIQQIRIGFSNHLHLAPTEAASATVALVGNQMQSVLEENMSSMKRNQEEDTDSRITIFSDDDDEEDDEEQIMRARNRRAAHERSQRDSREEKDIKAFGEDETNVFLNEKSVSKEFEEIERMAGSSSEEAKNNAQQVVEDMRNVSQYPAGGEPEEKEPEEIMDMLKELEENFEVNTDEDN